LGKQKKNCIVFTPNDIAVEMLDLLKYTGDLLGKKVLENSCGEGHILMEIVARYIKDCRRNGYKDNQICSGLEQDIYGFEINENTYETCLYNLNDLLKNYSLPNINWNIRKEDALKAKLPPIFSYVVGNPPYITYSALSIEDRNYIKKNFSVCTEGKPDYYYAFIESAIKSLNENGRFVYLVPSNFFKTKFAQKLREYIQPTLHEIYDYKEKRIFETTLTSSAILVLDKSAIVSEVEYHDVVNNRIINIKKKNLVEKWIFAANGSQKKDNLKWIRFGDLFKASSAIATLYNEAYIIKPNSDEYKLIEKRVLRLAASPKSYANKKVEYIIFPYYYDKAGNVKRYSADEFGNRFPHTVLHLKRYSDKLKNRDSDKTATWFEYGRSQAISHLNQCKLLLSTLVTGKLKIYELDEYTIPYSGIYIVAKSGNSLSDAKRILESKDFLAYIKKVGINANGKSIRIAIQDINNYQFHEL